MGGANTQTAQPEVRQATLPTAQDYAYHDQQVALEKQKRTQLAQNVMDSFGNIGASYSRGEPKSEEDELDQEYPRAFKPPKYDGTIQFSAVRPFKVKSSNQAAIGEGIASGIKGLSSGLLQGVMQRYGS